MTLIIALVLILLAMLFGWVTIRAWRASRAVVKWPGAIISGLLGTLCTVVGAVALVGLYRVSAHAGRPVPEVQVAGSPAQRDRGERLANLCSSCHSTAGRLPLDGGSENFLSGLGTLYSPNLTPGGSLKGWSDGEILRAIREGVDRNGRALLIMPSQALRHLSDVDAHAIVAYLRAQPAVNRQTPPTELNLLGAVLVGAGMFPTAAQRPITAPVMAPPAGPTPDYGNYLVVISGCAECHGADLRGGKPSGFGPPAGPNLPGAMAQWSADDFIKTMRTGVDPGGRSLNPIMMPWRELSAAYRDDELRAMYEYIRTLSP